MIDRSLILFAGLIASVMVFGAARAGLENSPPNDFERYYHATVVSVHDGDSITCEIEMGCKIRLTNYKIRLSGINAPELSAPGGQEAAAYLRKQVDGKRIVLMTYRDATGKYGRLLAVVWLKRSQNWKNINQKLLLTGHAEKY